MRSVRSALLSGALALGLGVSLAAPAAAAPGASPSTAPSFNDVVDVIVHRGDVVYVGGKFTSATDANGTKSRPGAAAFDVTTGELLPWSPRTNGRVYSIAAAKEGVYLGGAFTQVNGKTRKSVVKYSHAKLDGTGPGRLKAFRHGFNGAVRSIALDKRFIFVGGQFTKVNGKPRGQLARFSRTGKHGLQRWAPKATQGYVRDVKSTKAGVYVAGQFRKLNGRDAHGRLALLNPRSGKIIGRFNPDVEVELYGIALAKRRIFVAAGGPNGGYAAAFRKSNGSRAWKRRFDGDVQALTRLGGTVYVGGHFGRICHTDQTETTGDCLAGHDVRRRLAALGTGGGGLLDWAPDLNSELGVVSMAASGKHQAVSVGGAFTTVNGGSQARFALFD